MKNVFNPLRGKLFPLVLASIVLLLNTTHVFQAEDIIPYNSPYIVDTVNYKNEKIQPNTTAMHHGSNKSTLFALNKQSMSVIYKSLTAIIGIFAMSLMIVSCMRYLNKNKYRQLQSRRLAGNGTDGCNTEGNGDNKDGAAGGNASGSDDSDDDDDSDGEIDPELLKDEDHDIPYNDTETEIIESIFYLQSVESGESPVLSMEEIKQKLKAETKEYEAEIAARADALLKDPNSDFEKDGHTIGEVIEWQKSLKWTGVETMAYAADPTVLNSAVTQCKRVLELAMESDMGQYVKELHEFLIKLNGLENSDGFENEAVADNIKELKQKQNLTELQKALLHIYDALLPNLVQQNNSNADEYKLLLRGLDHMNKPEEELLDEYIKHKETPLYSDESDTEEGAAAETAK